MPKDREIVRLELTKEQKEQVKKETGKIPRCHAVAECRLERHPIEKQSDLHRPVPQIVSSVSIARHSFVAG